MFAATLSESFDFSNAAETFKKAAHRVASAAGVTIEIGTEQPDAAEAKPAEAAQPGFFARMSNSVSSSWENTKQLYRDIRDTPKVIEEACAKAGYDVRHWGPFMIVTRPAAE